MFGTIYELICITIVESTVKLRFILKPITVTNEISLLLPATKLGQSNIFSSVCQEFCPQGRVPGQVHPLAGAPPEGPPPIRYTPRQVPPSKQVHSPWAGTPPGQVPPLSRYTPPGQVHSLGRYTPQAGTPLLGRYTPNGQ